MTTPRGRQFQVVLPDGTKVWLNAASSIRYPTVFTGNTRQVSVTGEAYFEVTKNPKQPFMVSLGQTQVEVLGTHFDVMAYPDEPEIHTTLLEGAVKFSNGKEQAFLKPGEKGNTTRQANAKIRVKETDTDEAVAWVRGQLVMGDADMEKLVREISRWYDVDIIFEGPVPRRHFWSIINRNVNLSDVLQVLNANGVHTRKEGSKIIISAK
jgi:ferric-dicitrate binding protein FerR (iron transport regulator)